jgi:endonuclease/exonuclease/phosphatase family metal-dependent hydrolase
VAFSSEPSPHSGEARGSTEVRLRDHGTTSTLTATLLLAVFGAFGAMGCGSSGGGGRSTSAATTGAPVASSTTAGSTSSTTTPPGSTLPTGTLTVLTYNVAGLPQFISQVNPSTNTALISPKLNAFELVMVQEDFWYHADLVRDVRHAYQTPPLTSYSTLVNDGLNTFSSTPFHSLARVKWSRFHGLLSNSNDGLSSKGFTFARHVLGPGVEVDVYNHHADAGGDQGDIDAREFQFDQMADFIEAFSAGRPLIIVGDTNLHANRPGDMVILAAFLTRLGLTDAARSLNGTEKLDRVMVRSTADVELTLTSWGIAPGFLDAAGARLSDHDPVTVDLTWKRLR